MIFFLDENFPKTVTKLLLDHNHQVFDIRSTPDEGAEDEVIFKMAQKRKAIFLTTDKDFFHTIPHMHKSHHGIVIIALRQPNKKNIAEKLSWFLNHFDVNNMKSKVVLLKSNNYSVFPD